jgi:hypothetical protein
LCDRARAVATTPSGSQAFAFELEGSATRLRFAPALTGATFDAGMTAGGRGCRKDATHYDAKSVMLDASISATAAPPRGLTSNRAHGCTVANASNDAADVGGGDEHWRPRS